MSRYLVTGPYPYREHKPGETFEANLDPDVEERAVRKGAIRVLESSRVQLDHIQVTHPYLEQT